MAAYFAHELEMGGELVLTHPASQTLSILDVESYPTFIRDGADPLDLMAHVGDEMTHLTAFSWDVPAGPLRIRLRVTNDHRAMELLTFSSRPPSASGTLRTAGELCLVGHERLLDCAGDATHNLFKGARLTKAAQPHLLRVPPGILYALVYYQWPDDQHHPAPATGETEHRYVVYLHHYPHPAPRIAPRRLPGLLPQGS